MVDKIAAIILIAFNAVYLYLTFRLEKRGFSTGELGPEFYPAVLSGVLFILAFLLLVRGKLSGLKNSPKKLRSGDGEFYRSILAMGFMVAYAVSLSQIGFLKSTPIFLISFLILSKVRKWWVTLIAAGGTTLAIYVVFWNLFNIRLP